MNSTLRLYEKVGNIGDSYHFVLPTILIIREAKTLSNSSRPPQKNHTPLQINVLPSNHGTILIVLVTFSFFEFTFLTLHLSIDQLLNLLK